MEERLLRKNGRGIVGTLENSKHHAKRLTSIVESLWNDHETYGFVLWEAGHNLHRATTRDGRRFTFRPIVTDGEGYVGIRMYIENSRASRAKVATFYHDNRNCVTIDMFKMFIKMCADDSEGETWHLKD